MRADYVQHMGSDLVAVNAARVSMDKESGWEYDSSINDDVEHIKSRHLKDADVKLIKYLAANKHDSCFEHQSVTLRLKVPLFVRSQIHRHRTFAYNEVSRRYVKDNLEFYWPDKWRKAAANVKQGSSDESVSDWDDENDCRVSAERLAHWAAETAVTAFKEMIEHGVCAEQARMILPQNLYTSFYMTGNLRNWCHFLKLRLDPHAQREVQDIAKQCAALIEPLFPVSYSALMSC